MNQSLGSLSLKGSGRLPSSPLFVTPFFPVLARSRPLATACLVSGEAEGLVDVVSLEVKPEPPVKSRKSIVGMAIGESHVPQAQGEPRLKLIHSSFLRAVYPQGQDTVTHKGHLQR